MIWNPLRGGWDTHVIHLPAFFQFFLWTADHLLLHLDPGEKHDRLEIPFVNLYLSTTGFILSPLHAFPVIPSEATVTVRPRGLKYSGLRPVWTYADLDFSFTFETRYFLTFFISLQNKNSKYRNHSKNIQWVLTWNCIDPVSISSCLHLSLVRLCPRSHTKTHGSSVREMKRDPLLWLLSSSLGRMRDCVGVRELLHQPLSRAEPRPWSTLLCSVWTRCPLFPAPLSHMIEASGNGNSQANLTWHTRRVKEPDWMQSRKVDAVDDMRTAVWDKFGVNSETVALF